MKREEIFLVGTHRYSFRPCQPAKIVGVTMGTPDGLGSRPCFVVLFRDNKQDFVPIFGEPPSTVKNPDYEFVTESDISAGKIPAVTR